MVKHSETICEKLVFNIASIGRNRVSEGGTASRKEIKKTTRGAGAGGMSMLKGHSCKTMKRIGGDKRKTENIM